MNPALLRVRLYEDSNAEEFEPGVWQEVSCQEYEGLMGSLAPGHLHNLVSMSDRYGEYGEPLAFTIWGNDEGVPSLATLSEYDRDGHITICHHVKRVGTQHRADRCIETQRGER